MGGGGRGERTVVLVVDVWLDINAMFTLGDT